MAKNDCMLLLLFVIFIRARKTKEHIVNLNYVTKIVAKKLDIAPLKLNIERGIHNKLLFLYHRI